MDALRAWDSPVPDNKQTELFGAEKSREYRRQQKAKRKELRLQEVSIRQKLTALQLLKKEEFAKLDATRSQSYLLWRDLAARLQEERRSAEFRQEQLIGAISNQAIYINTIRDIVGKQLSTAMALRRDGSPHRQRIGNSGGAESFAGYIQRLDANFQITNEVFRAFDALFASVPHAVHKQVTDGAVEYFSVRSKVVLPLSPLEAGNTLWDFGSQFYSNKEGFVRYQDVQDPENTLVKSFVESSVLQTGMQVKIQQYFIARRFYLDNQVIMTWHFISEGIGVFSGLRADETGWWRLEASSDPMEPGTVLEMCVCRAPAPSTETTFAKSVADDFHGVLHRISDKTMDDVVSLTESALLRNLLEEME